jgi:hypothetical protein
MPYKPPVTTFKKDYSPCTQKCTEKAPGEFKAEPIDDNLLRAKRAITESGGVLTAMWLYAGAAAGCNVQSLYVIVCHASGNFHSTLSALETA